MPGRRALPDRRRAGHGARVLNLDEATAPLSRDADPGRGAGHGDALFVGHDRQAEGRAPAAARPAAGQPHPIVAAFIDASGGSARADLPVAGAALSRRALGRRRRHDPPRRHGRRDGAVRRRGVSRAGRAPSGHATRNSCRPCSRAC